MSWFSGSTKVYVSSVPYNLAGDIDHRPNFLKTAVVGAVLGDAPSIPESISNSYLHGPGMQLKAFARWARHGTYNADMGMQDGVISKSPAIDLNTLSSQISAITGQTISVQSARTGDADYTAWADRWVAQNHPDKIAAGYTAHFIRNTSGSPYTIRIAYTDLSVDTFDPTDFALLGQYLYATYVVVTGDSSGSGSTWSVPQIFIYAHGTGNADLDAYWNAVAPLGTFFPFIPFRIDNQRFDELYPTTLYPEAKKAFKKATGSSYDKVMKKILGNASIGDIDYAYVVFGVSLNTKEQSAQKYIYRFFKAIADDPNQTGEGTYASYQAQWNAAEQSWVTWKSWYHKNSTYISGHGSQNWVPADPQDPEPELLPFPSMPINSISVTSNGNSVMNYNMTIKWNYIAEDSGTGMIEPNGKIDQVWIENTVVAYAGTPFWQRDPLGRYVPVFPSGTSTPSIVIKYQVDANNWKSLTIAGLVHQNLIYHGNAVEIDCLHALTDTSESGFIIPLHEDIYKSMSIKDYTQMATACCYLVFNCYTVVETPWYQTGWFQIILIVAIVVVSVLTLGVGTVGATVGVLGTNAGVGAALGLAAGSLMAVIIGAIANSLAAMILLMVLTKGATAAFGDKLGTLISSILGIVVTMGMQISAGLKSGQSLSSIFKDLTSATKLINLTSSVGNTFADYIKSDTQDILGQISSYQKELTGKIKSVEDQAAALFGYDKGTIDPTMFTDAGASNFVYETLATFLDRTLMTGTDIAELSMSMISDFTKLTLTTDLT